MANITWLKKQLFELLHIFDSMIARRYSTGKLHTL